MCFHIHPDYPNPILAEKDITCYKVLLKHPINKKFQSPYQYVPYEIETLIESEIGTPHYKVWEERNGIDSGLHSFSSIIRAGRYTNQEDNRRIFKATIPKGSYYYFNPEKKEYVSNKLIVNRISNRSLITKLITA